MRHEIYVPRSFSRVCVTALSIDAVPKRAEKFSIMHRRFVFTSYIQEDSLNPEWSFYSDIFRI